MITETVNKMFYVFFNLVAIISFQAFVLVVWFNSDIVKTLSKIKIFNKLFKYDEYVKLKNSVAESFLDYPSYLGITYDNPLAKLLSCPICVNFWMTLFFCVCFYIYFWPIAFFVYISSMLIYVNIRKGL